MIPAVVSLMFHQLRQQIVMLTLAFFTQLVCPCNFSNKTANNHTSQPRTNEMCKSGIIVHFPQRKFAGAPLNISFVRSHNLVQNKCNAITKFAGNSSHKAKHPLSKQLLSTAFALIKLSIFKQKRYSAP